MTIDSHPIPKIMFRTPLDRSFTCKDIGNFPLFTTMTFYPVPNTPVTLPNTTVNTSELKFDAFRDDGRAIPTGFRVSIFFLFTLQGLINGLSPINAQSGQHIKINKRHVPN